MLDLKEQIEIVQKQNDPRAKEIQKLNERFIDVWRVDVDDECLTFTKEKREQDFFETAKEQPYGELNGTYLGNRGYDSTSFKLVRRLKASNFYDGPDRDQWGNFSLKKWRESYGYGYAWEPSTYYKYKDKLYVTHINFR